MRRNLILPILLAGTILLLPNTVQATAPADWHQTKSYPELLQASCAGNSPGGAAYIICFDVTPSVLFGGHLRIQFDDKLGTHVGAAVLFDGNPAQSVQVCGNSTLSLPAGVTEVMVQMAVGNQASAPVVPCNFNVGEAGATVGTVAIDIMST